MLSSKHAPIPLLASGFLPDVTSVVSAMLVSSSWKRARRGLNKNAPPRRYSAISFYPLLSFSWIVPILYFFSPFFSPGLPVSPSCSTPVQLIFYSSLFDTPFLCIPRPFNAVLLSWVSKWFHYHCCSVAPNVEVSMPLQSLARKQPPFNNECDLRSDPFS